MKRAYSPKEIAKKTYKTLPWGGKWEEAFGLPEENSTWFISGASASGKSSFVMQLAYELTHYGQVLYLSYEEGLNQSFQERMLRFEKTAQCEIYHCGLVPGRRLGMARNENPARGVPKEVFHLHQSGSQRPAIRQTRRQAPLPCWCQGACGRF